MKNTIFNCTIFILLIILILIISIIIIKNYAFYNGNIIDNNSSIGGNVDNIDHNSDCKLTYSINGEDSGLDYTQLRKILHNFKEVDKTTPSVNLSIGGFDEKYFKESGKSAYSESFLKQKASLKNLLDKHRMITEKTQLYISMKNNIPMGMKYLPYTNSLANIKSAKELFHLENKGDNSKCIYVLKINKSRQTGIKIISSEDELNLAIKQLEITKKEDAIISKYITNPLTIDGKKFHLRVYFLVYIRWGITYCTAFDEYKILTASSPYVQSDWLNESIHLSGGKNTSKRYNWDDISKTINEETKISLLECIKSICKAIVLTGMRPFEEADSAYHTFGADIILTDDNMAYLLEINRRAAMTQIGEDLGWDEYNKQFSYNYFMFIAKHVIFPYFGLELPQLAYAKFANGFHSSLAEFSNLFIENKLELLPLKQANDNYRQQAHMIHFYSLLSFQKILTATSEENIWIILKNNEAIGYVCIIYIKTILDGATIQIGVAQSHQRRQIGTAIIALLMDIYASRKFPKNPTLYMPILQNLHTRDMMPTNKIALKLGFKINNKLKMYSRLCKILSPKFHTNLSDLKMYIITENHNYDIFKIFNPYFIKKEGYSFAHVVFGNIQNNEYYLSNGIRYTVNFLNQGAEIKNCLKMKDGIIYKKYRLYEQLKELYTKTNNVQFLNTANRCKSISLDQFKTYSELIEYGKNNQFIFNNGKVNKFIYYKIGTILEIISQEDFNSIDEYDYISQINNNNIFKINDKPISFVSIICVYKTSGIVYAFLEDEIIHIDKKEDNDHKIIMLGEDTTPIPYEKFKSNKQHIIDPNALQENIKSCTQLLLNNATLYPEQHSGFHKYGILNSLYNIDGKIIPYISEIFSIIKNTEFNEINYINFIGKNIILPHFGIIPKSIPYMTYNCNDGALSKFYDKIINLSIVIDKNKSNLFHIYLQSNIIGHIKLEIISHEIEIKHIELDSKHQKQNISTIAIAQLLEILGARYAPLNPIIFFKQLESIAEKLEFHKIKHKDIFIYKRLCRIKKFIE